MPSNSWLRRGRHPRAVAVLLVAAVAVLAGCSSLVEGRPTPTPLDFGGINVAFRSAGILIGNTTSGDAGCSDPNLVPTAIAFEASGLDEPTPVQLRIYIFSSRAAFDRRRADVDACIAQWAADPATFETVDASPYVLAGQGPWPIGFKTAVSAALRVAAGNGD